MIYFAAGLFAEGPTDYRFLGGLVDRLLYSIAVDIVVGNFEIGPMVCLDAPPDSGRGRERTVPAAVESAWGTFDLLIVHADGNGDPERMRERCVDAPAAAVGLHHPAFPIVGCVPVREIEAWLLAEPEVFQKLFRTDRIPKLPSDPARERDPKVSLDKALRACGKGKAPDDVYDFFGQNVAFEPLRRLDAFARFERDLAAAVRVVSSR